MARINGRTVSSHPWSLLPGPWSRSSQKLTKFGYQSRFYRRLRAANRRYSPERDMAASPFPSVIQLQTINACQAACTMCPYPLFKDVFARGRMEDSLFTKIIDEIAGHEEVETFIPMLQNEPLLDKRLFGMIRRFKERTDGRVTTELVTNGALLTESVVAELREARLDILDISLDALSRETYAKIRRGLDYDTVLEGVNRVLNANIEGMNVFVRLVKVRDNIAEVKSFARHWRKLGVPVFMYTANNRVGALEDFDEELRVREVPLLHRIGRRAVRAWLGHCPSPFASANILHNGDVLVCTHDWARKEVVGNMRDATLSEIWNGERMREIRRLISERRYMELPACRECSLWKDGWV